MFFVHELEQTITIHPSFFGPNIHEHLINKLIHDVEGTNTGSYFIVCIMDQTWQISEGRVIPGSAHAEYTIHYEAVVWKPFKFEVLDGTVSSVIDKGFFVDIGPLSAFVSRSMIPPEIKFDANSTPAQWTDNNEQVIEKGTQIRVKIKGVRAEVDRMYAIATIKEDYLGPLPFMDLMRDQITDGRIVLDSHWERARRLLEVDREYREGKKTEGKLSEQEAGSCAWAPPWPPIHQYNQQQSCLCSTHKRHQQAFFPPQDNP
ncbi:DNA-directed RNA polymerase II subunit [Coniosporium tulheliwenetii]|uniref:DNA-directed RNA polymerase II subunit n=1 Tax=Coniosporium tulheliwenetii TaxID=3383036 RepID=A0ACC2ZG08_9PEZI|nr:DNA-directed RNA polymerase II subunit [Cladosporium sp. JES 115]